MDEHDVIHDWNTQRPHQGDRWRTVELHDETLRDGLQSPSVADPSLEDKLTIVELLSELGVASADVGLPGAGRRAAEDACAVIQHIVDNKLEIRPSLAARTHPSDIRPCIEIAEQTGARIEAMMFLGTSPIRLYTEGWSEERLESLTRNAMQMATEGGLMATFVTEDTTRSQPALLERLFTAAVEEGATRLVLCDTVGHATPAGTRALVSWTVDLLQQLGVHERVAVDWHGHDDRGLSLINALAASEAGADRVHGTVLGLGERVGNTPLDQLIINLKLHGVLQRDMQQLAELVYRVSAATERPIPLDYPVFGADAFRTGTGVHAAAVIKACTKGDRWLRDRIYSGVPAEWFGRDQEITVGPMSGASNVRYWLTSRGYTAPAPLVEAILSAAKSTRRMLRDDEILEIRASLSAKP